MPATTACMPQTPARLPLEHRFSAPLPNRRCAIASLGMLLALTGSQFDLPAAQPAPKPLTPAATATPERAPATSSRFVPERKDDFAWENDQVAFRAYGPALRAGPEDSGIDCWIKRVPYPIIDSWYAGASKGHSYHQDHGEGYDPYHVGSSRGCGGLALWRDDQLVLSDTFTAWRVIERSRERSVFELDYVYPADAASGAAPIVETKRISIRLGEPFFRVEARFTRGGQPVADLALAIGVTTHDGKARATLNAAKRWIACWESIDGAGLGTGAVLAGGFPAETREVKSAAKDASHALLITRTNAAGVVVYHAGFAWTKAGRIHSPEEWAARLDARAAATDCN